MLGLFLANPEKFVDTAGQATQYAVEQFAKAGIQLATAVGGSAAEGLGRAITDSLGVSKSLARGIGILAAGAVAAVALLVLLGLPVRMLLWPVLLPLKWLHGNRTRTLTNPISKS